MGSKLCLVYDDLSVGSHIEASKSFVGFIMGIPAAGSVETMTHEGGG